MRFVHCNRLLISKASAANHDIQPFFAQVVGVFVGTDHRLLSVHVIHYFFEVGFSFHFYAEHFRLLAVCKLPGYVNKRLAGNAAKIKTVAAHIAGVLLNQQYLDTDGMSRQGHTKSATSGPNHNQIVFIFHSE